jgi:hypothetical protein
MLSPSNVSGFAFQRGDGSREVQAVSFYANMQRIPRCFFRRAEDVPVGWVPVGNVTWVGACLRRAPEPDYYPDFLRPWLHRDVWRAEKWPNKVVFAKPADCYKRFTGFVGGLGRKGRKRGPLWCSDVVKFVNEWRYYVANGRVLTAHWYAGDEVLTPDAPSLPNDIVWPLGWCGAVDFGQMSDGRVALVEAQHPFSCGWYGRLGEGRVYAEWLVDGWRWLQSPV